MNEDQKKTLKVLASNPTLGVLGGLCFMLVLHGEALIGLSLILAGEDEELDADATGW